MMMRSLEKESMRIRSTEFVAVDPLALMLRGDIYARISIDWKYPHVPKVEEVRAAARSLTIEEKEVTLARARTMIEYAKVVEEAMNVPG
jgi:hypothetical protein